MSTIKKQILEKQKKVEYIRGNIERSSAVIFYNFSYADNNEVFLLKKKLRTANSKWFVCKNILFKRAFPSENLQVSNNNAFIFCMGDQYEPLKILRDFSFRKDLERRIQGGIYNGEIIDHQTLTSWSSLKSKKALLGDFCNLLVFSMFNLTVLLDAANKK